MLKRKICSTRTRKSTFVGRSSPNHYRKAVNTTQHGDLALRVQQLEATNMSLQQQGLRT